MYTLVKTTERDRWNGYISKIPDADIYFTAEYCEIYMRNGEGEAELFVYEEGEDLVCYTYLVRRINQLPVIEAAGLCKPLFDISTPYGYGGPITNVKNPEQRKILFTNFSSEFDKYCLDKGIFTEFVRFHPIMKNHLDYTSANPTFMRNTIYIDLTLSQDEITDRYKPDCRNRIRRAEKENLEIVHSNPHNSKQLLQLYYATMDKNSALPYYYFPETFFQNTIHFLEGNIELIEVLHGSQTVTSAIFMHYNKYVHYHLSGSDKQSLKYGPVNLLIDHTVKWAKEQGYEYLHLGGGYVGNDTLYRFKSSFQDRIPLDFYIGRKVHDTFLYDKLMRHHSRYDLNDYFPFYRNPKLQIEHV